MIEGASQKFDGNACPRCGTTLRYVSDGRCVNCRRRSNRRDKDKNGYTVNAWLSQRLHERAKALAQVKGISMSNLLRIALDNYVQKETHP